MSRSRKSWSTRTRSTNPGLTRQVRPYLRCSPLLCFTATFEIVRRRTALTDVEFADTPKHIQLAHITSLLDNLNSTDPDQRFTAARNVLYIAQGPSSRCLIPKLIFTKGHLQRRIRRNSISR